MYKNKEFDYDLWKDADGKCYARVRSTGEVCEISDDTGDLTAYNRLLHRFRRL